MSKTPDKTDDISFQSNGVLTLGVEIELQLIDPTTYNLSSRAEELLAATSALHKVKPELYLSMIEINTDKCNDVHESHQDLRDTLQSLIPIANDMSIRFSSAGAHPFAKYSDSIVAPGERYQSLIDRNQWLARRTTVYGLHVHIGMASGDDCIRYNNFFMNFLPHLLALSASSPFWQGTDTGLSSCRPTMYEAIPTAGQPYHVRNWREFEHLYHTLKGCGSIGSMKDLWWDMRPSPHFGTLEIRVCDGPATLKEAMAITAYIHLLAHWFKDNGSWLESVNYPPRWLSRENKWRAIRHGLEAELVLSSEGKIRHVRDDISEWVERIKPYAEKLGYEGYMRDIIAITRNGNSSERQRRCFQKTNSLEEVAKLNVDEFMSQTPSWEA